MIRNPKKRIIRLAGNKKGQDTLKTVGKMFLVLVTVFIILWFSKDFFVQKFRQMGLISDVAMGKAELCTEDPDLCAVIKEAIKCNDIVEAGYDKFKCITDDYMKPRVKEGTSSFACVGTLDCAKGRCCRETVLKEGKT